MTTSRNILQPIENFIGRKFNDNKLEVIGIADYRKHKNIALFKVTCTECSKDPELFPDGYFIATKHQLENGGIPCGCSKSHKWKKEQYLIKARRIGNEKGFIIHGYFGEYDNAHSKFDCECLIDGYKWTPIVNEIINSNTGCPECRKKTMNAKFKTSEIEAFKICQNICNQMGYEFIGFPNGYKNSKSVFEYVCPKHGTHKVTYNLFVHKGTRCPECARYGYNPNKSGSFYVTRWKKDNNSFIKFGITNNKVLSRIKQQSRGTDYDYTILSQYSWDDGFIALNLEKSIKQHSVFNIGIISYKEFNDGFTETIKESDLHLLMDHVNSKLERIDGH